MASATNYLVPPAAIVIGVALIAGQQGSPSGVAHPLTLVAATILGSFAQLMTQPRASLVGKVIILLSLATFFSENFSIIPYLVDAFALIALGLNSIISAVEDLTDQQRIRNQLSQNLKKMMRQKLAQFHLNDLQTAAPAA